MPSQAEDRNLARRDDVTSVHKLRLVVLVGPTAVGKTETAIELAIRLNGEIVSADSRLFYRGMDIGTAKPTPEELSQVRHHLIDVADPVEVWGLGKFQAEARKAIVEIHARGKLPLLVGGTGQYIRAVTRGWIPPEVKPDPALRLVLEKWAEQIGPEELHSRLSKLDLAAAQGIDYRNIRRTVRALEVIFTTGRLFSDQRLSEETDYDLLTIGLFRHRKELYARIDERIDRMLADGLIEEVRGLLVSGYGPELPAMSAIGYRQVVAFLDGEITLDEAVVEMRRKTRVYVRRQANWFKEDDPDIRWFLCQPRVVDLIELFIRSWLSGR